MLFTPPPFILGTSGLPPGPVTGLSFVASATSDNSATVTVPSSAETGDLAVLFDNDNSATPDKVIPAGYTEVTDVGGGTDGELTVSYKVLESGDPGNNITGMNGTPSNKCVVVVRPNAEITTVTPSTWNGEITSGDPASQTVLASGETAPLVVFGCGAVAVGTMTFTTASPAFDDEILNANADMITGYKLYDSSPADHTIDTGDNGSDNILVSGWIEVA